MWFATQDGLNRYDGYSFTHYEHDDNDSTSLSDNYVNVILEDHSGELWAGTRGGGLDRYVPETGRFVRYRFDPRNDHSLSNDEVRCIYEDHAGTLWVGTTNGLNRYDRRTNSFARYVHDPLNRWSIPSGLVECVFEDNHDNLWIGMLGAVAKFDRTSGKFSELHLPVPGILCVWIGEDDNGNLWVAMQNELYIYNGGRWLPASKKFHLNKALLIRRILKDGRHNIWFGGDNGLLQYDEVSGDMSTFVNDPADPLSLSGNSILSLYEDRQGTIWIGTYDGISKYSPAEFKFRHVNLSMSKVHDAGWNKIRSFCEDKSGKIWVATQEGLMTYDRRANTLTRISIDAWYTRTNNQRLLWSLLEEKNASLPTLWVGTNGQGLIKLSFDRTGKSSFTKYLPHAGDSRSLSGPSPVTLYEARDGTLWVGTLWEGLNRFDRRDGKFMRYVNDPANPQSISGNEIWSLCEDRSGFLWIGTAGEGLDRFDTATGVFTRYHHDPHDSLSLSDDKVTSIVEDSQGSIWIGTYTGLNRFDPHSGAFEHFTMLNGLPNNVIYGIVDDKKGNLWLSTNNGLSRLNLATRTFRNYDEGDGLQSNEFNYGAAYRCRDGELLFGGVNGFNIFSPDTLAEDTNIPEVVLTDFKVFNKSIQPSPSDRRLTTDISDAKVIRLSYKDAVISFGFAALEYNNPSKNQYSYKMEGFDKEWVNAGSRREATYTNLDPGEYVFRVRASNSDGVWNDSGTSIMVRISPPYWETWWFRSTIVLVFLSVGPLVYFRRVTTLKKRQSLQQEFSRRLIESQEAERKRIAAELHDSIGQDLLVIKNKLLFGLQSEQKSGAVTKDFEEAVNQVSDSLKHVREISRNLRPIQLDQIGLTAALESVVETAAESSNMQSKIQIDNIDNLLSKEGEINLFRIVQESLNNILKHARALTLSVKIVKYDKTLSMEIEDDGRGMESRYDGTKQQDGLGLRGMAERARILGGDLRFESNIGRGTKITLIVPLVNSNG